VLGTGTSEMLLTHSKNNIILQDFGQQVLGWCPSRMVITGLQSEQMMERASSTHRIRDWVDHSASLDTMKKMRISCSCQELNPNSSIIQNVAHLLYQLGYPGSIYNRQETHTQYSNSAVFIFLVNMNISMVYTCIYNAYTKSSCIAKHITYKLDTTFCMR
jgi:hypothetical protein